VTAHEVVIGEVQPNRLEVLSRFLRSKNKALPMFEEGKLTMDRRL
jgi:hypothetical protein